MLDSRFSTLILCPNNIYICLVARLAHPVYSGYSTCTVSCSILNHSKHCIQGRMSYANNLAIVTHQCFLSVFMSNWEWMLYLLKCGCQVWDTSDIQYGHPFDITLNGDKEKSKVSLILCHITDVLWSLRIVEIVDTYLPIDAKIRNNNIK